MYRELQVIVLYIRNNYFRVCSNTSLNNHDKTYQVLQKRQRYICVLWCGEWEGKIVQNINPAAVKTRKAQHKKLLDSNPCGGKLKFLVTRVIDLLQISCTSLPSTELREIVQLLDILECFPVPAGRNSLVWGPTKILIVGRRKLF